MDVADEVSVHPHADVLQVSKKGRIKGVECRCGHLSLALDTHERHLVRVAITSSKEGGIADDHPPSQDSPPG